MVDKSTVFGNESSNDKRQCSNEIGDKIVLDRNNIQEQFEFVKKFIHEYGRVYDYDIRKCLEEFDVSESTIKSLVNKRRNMYERLSKL